MKTHELAFIGNEFYYESSTLMSSLIVIDANPGRWDWGRVSVALENGDAVHIRPATTQEISEAHKKLKTIKDSR